MATPTDCSYCTQLFAALLCPVTKDSPKRQGMQIIVLYRCPCPLDIYRVILWTWFLPGDKWSDKERERKPRPHTSPYQICLLWTRFQNNRRPLQKERKRKQIQKRESVFKKEHHSLCSFAAFAYRSVVGTLSAWFFPHVPARKSFLFLGRLWYANYYTDHPDHMRSKL